MRFGIPHNVFTKILVEDYLLVGSKFTCLHQNSYQYNCDTYINLIAMYVRNWQVHI